MKDYYVHAYKFGKCSVISGLGRNKNTLDCSLSMKSAQKYAKQLSKEKQWQGHTFQVESNIEDEVFGIYENGKKIG